MVVILDEQHAGTARIEERDGFRGDRPAGQPADAAPRAAFAANEQRVEPLGERTEPCAARLHLGVGEARIRLLEERPQPGRERAQAAFDLPLLAQYSPAALERASSSALLNPGAMEASVPGSTW